MPVDTRHETRTHPRESSFFTLLSGWAQQGVASFLATQRILVDLAMRQNASVMEMMRERLSDPRHSPTAMLTELTGEGMANFIEAQRVLLDMAHEQNEIIMTGVKERMGDSAPATAMMDMLRRSMDTFITMQMEFMKIAGKQTHAWMEATRTNKPFKGDQFVEMAQQGMENFIEAQKKFLDVVAEETAKATGGKHSNGARKMKKTELTQLAQQATESFVDAQKKLFDLANRQMNTGLKLADRTMGILKPFPFVPLADLTREGVKSYVNAQKAMMDVVLKPAEGHKRTAKPERRGKRPMKREAAAAHSAA